MRINNILSKAKVFSAVSHSDDTQIFALCPSNTRAGRGWERHFLVSRITHTLATMLNRVDFILLRRPLKRVLGKGVRMRLLRRGRIWGGGGRREGYDQRAGDSSIRKKAAIVTQERDGESLTLLTGGRVEEEVGRRNEFTRFPQPPRLFTRGCHWESSLLHLDCSAASAAAVATFNLRLFSSGEPPPHPAPRLASNTSCYAPPLVL